MYSKQAILDLIKSGQINIVPFNDEQLESVHVNLHLAEDLQVEPKSFAISRTREKITLSTGICGLIDGRAGLAKQGISIHQSSSLLEPSTDNLITLEIFNAGEETIRLYAGQEVAKLIIFGVSSR